MKNLILSLILSLTLTIGICEGIDSDTKLVLNFNGADAATTTTDETGRHSTINFRGTAQLDTAQKKWGASSLYLDGNTAYLDIADSADWDIEDGNSWTVDFWFRFEDNDSPDTSQVPLAQRVDNSFWAWNHKTAKGGWRFESTVGVGAGGYASPSSDGEWDHFMHYRSGAATGEYKNGNQIAWDSSAGTGTIAGSLYIGSKGTSSDERFHGWIDTIRIQKSNVFSASPNSGKTDTYTVPTDEYVEDASRRIMNITKSELKIQPRGDYRKWEDMNEVKSGMLRYLVRSPIIRVGI